MRTKNDFFLRKVVNLLSVCLYWKDKNFRYVGCNLAQLKALGYSSESEIRGKMDNELYPQAIATKLHQLDRQVAKSMTPVEVEEVRITTTGEPLTFLSRKVPLFDEKKTFKGIASISVNITELNEAITPTKTKPIEIHVKTTKKPKNLSLAKIKILLVEDAPLAQEMTAAILLNLKCSVDIVNTIKDALQHFKKTKYDLIIADLSLQDGSGIELAKLIRLYEKQHKLNVTPLVGLTAYANNSIKKLCYNAKFDQLLIKPLLKNRAEDLLTTYVKSYKADTTSDAFSTLPIKDEIINYNDLNKITEDGSIDPFITIFPMMLEALHTEKPKLQSAYANKNWSALHFLVHKLRGSAAYCAAKRLEKSCEQVETYLETHKKISQKEFNLLYKHLLKEMQTLKQKLLSIQAKNK